MRFFKHRFNGTIFWPKCFNGIFLVALDIRVLIAYSSCKIQMEWFKDAHILPLLSSHYYLISSNGIILWRTTFHGTIHWYTHSNGTFSIRMRLRGTIWWNTYFDKKKKVLRYYLDTCKRHILMVQASYEDP